VTPIAVPQLLLPRSAEVKAAPGRAAPTSARQPASATRNIRPPARGVFTDDVVLPPTLHVPVARVAPQPQALRTMGALGVAPVARGGGTASEGGTRRGRRRHRGSAEGSGQTTTTNQVTRVHQRLSAPPALLPVRSSPMAFVSLAGHEHTHTSAAASSMQQPIDKPWAAGQRACRGASARRRRRRRRRRSVRRSAAPDGAPRFIYVRGDGVGRRQSEQRRNRGDGGGGALERACTRATHWIVTSSPASVARPFARASPH
jgi:hypothetical protein